jgi:hypothetical protein
LTLDQTAANTWQVIDGSSSQGTYSGVGDIIVIGSNAKSSESINLGGFSYTGNLFLNTGNGTDTVWVNGAAGSAILGNTNILAGNGHDSIQVAVPTIGGSLQVTSTEGTDSVSIGTGSASILGPVTVVNAVSVNLGTGADTFGGNVSVSSTIVNLPATVNIGSGGSTVFDGNVSVTGGQGNDTVNLAAASVAGNLNVSTGVGNDSFAVTQATTVSGNFTLQQGSGNDNVALGSLTVQSNAQINLGDGTDTVTATTGTVQGNLSVQAGNGADSVSLAATEAVNGTLLYQLGNGADTVNSFASVGGRTEWYSGNGNDSFTLGSGANNYDVYAQFGNGADTFTLATTGLVWGTVDGGTNPNNVFVQGMATLTSPWTLSNFP